MRLANTTNVECGLSLGYEAINEVEPGYETS